jgi:hypothetical protein
MLLNSRVRQSNFKFQNSRSRVPYLKIDVSTRIIVWCVLLAMLISVEYLMRLFVFGGLCYYSVAFAKINVCLKTKKERIKNKYKYLLYFFLS